MRYVLSAVLSLGLLVSYSDTLAKDLTNRLGVGYTDQFSTTDGSSLPSVAVQYFPRADLGFSAALGVDTNESNSKFGFMAKMYRILFTEDNMNFYMGAGAALLSEETGSSTSSGFEINGFGGGEFFFDGLESVGFSFEMGVGIVSVSSQVRFRTIGDHPMRAGIIFYF